MHCYIRTEYLLSLQSITCVYHTVQSLPSKMAAHAYGNMIWHSRASAPAESNCRCHCSLSVIETMEACFLIIHFPTTVETSVHSSCFIPPNVAIAGDASTHSWTKWFREVHGTGKSSLCCHGNSDSFVLRFSTWNNSDVRT